MADALKARGFTVAEVANDTSGRKVTGVGELRHGPPGNDAADFVRLYLPGAGDYPDTRATAMVDVVIGPDFKTLATPDEVAAALAAGEGRRRRLLTLSSRVQLRPAGRRTARRSTTPPRSPSARRTGCRAAR